MNLTLKVWRQTHADDSGHIETYPAENIPDEASFLEMLDIVNERILADGHDPIHFDGAKRGEASLGFERPSNNAGGLEGGMTNGQPVVVRGTMKPISTLLRGLPSVNLNSRQPEDSQYERSDVCAVSAASVVMEHAVAFEIARASLTKFGGDSLAECRANLASYLQAARNLPAES